MVGLGGTVASALCLAIAAAGHPSSYVPARSGGWPGWLSGPLDGVGLTLSSGAFQALTLIMCASYVATLAAARRLPGRAIAIGVVAANLALVLGPPLISQDVFGYLAFGRLGVLHGLDPYAHVAAEAPADAVFPFVGWPFQHSPYGPLFTLGSYAIVPLGLAGGLWALKLIAALASLAAVALTARAAERTGGSARVAAVFVGLNPVLLELAVGGAHNDTLVLVSIAGALALGAGALRFRSAAVALAAGVGVKASAGLMLPFLILAPASRRERLRAGVIALGALALLAVVAMVGFGTHGFGFLDALGEQQQLVATHSVPAETARWIGLHGLPTWWRDLFAAGFLVALVIALWRTARGADWRAMAGWATLALLLSTAWLLPWYAVWLLPLAAVADSRGLRAAALLFCAYAVLIHLPIADPVLSPPRHLEPAVKPAVTARVEPAVTARVEPAVAARVQPAVTAADHGVVFARLEVHRHVAFDLLR
jgi:alpha-1,6-mannosyltransferase